MSLIVVTLNFATFILAVDKKGIIVEAPPIMCRWKGQAYDKFYMYYYGKGKLVKTVKV